ncbi:glutaredoxin [Clostridiales bacterium PH28_bin88]|nr:glutaredoxin [Clostridiales bacterium PH28_bin88]
MKIEVLGTGCPKCLKTEQVIREVLEEMGLQAEVVKVTDIDDIVARGVMITPAVVIDDNKVLEGKIPGKNEVESWLGK